MQEITLIPSIVPGDGVKMKYNDMNDHHGDRSYSPSSTLRLSVVLSLGVEVSVDYPGHRFPDGELPKIFERGSSTALCSKNVSYCELVNLNCRLVSHP
jgi:hypothetical protein